MEIFKLVTFTIVVTSLAVAATHDVRASEEDDVNESQPVNQTYPVTDENQICEQKELSSWGYQRHEEKMNMPVVSLTLMEEHYKHDVICVRDQSFGFTAATVWVDQGCRATFMLCTVIPEKFDRKVAALEHKVEQLIAELDEVNEANGAKIEQQNAEINSLKQTLNLEKTKVRDCITPAVGFMAVISGSGRPATIAKNTDVVFDKILTDSSSSYDTSTGRFLCEIAGLYQFSVSVATIPTDAGTDKPERKYALFSLMVNDRVITTAIADSSDVWDAASVSATVMLNKGDTVFVKNATPWPADPSQWSDWQPNTFSGHLVVKAGCEM